MPEYSPPKKGAENSRAFSAASITPPWRGLFAKGAGEAGQEIVHRIVVVLEEADAFVARHHGRAALRERRPVEADHRQAVAVTRGGDLVADSSGWRGDLGHENVGLFDPAEVALEDLARGERLAVRADVLRGHGAGEDAMALLFQRL